MFLYLNHNKLKEFTHILPPNLQYLYLYNNQLTKFSSLLTTNLIKLDLSNNNLNEFTQEMTPNLLFLGLNNNPFKDLNGKEYEIKTLEELIRYQEIIRRHIKNKTIKSANK